MSRSSYIDGWDVDKWAMILCSEVDAARAEVERLTAENERLRWVATVARAYALGKAALGDLQEAFERLDGKTDTGGSDG